MKARRYLAGSVLLLLVLTASAFLLFHNPSTKPAQPETEPKPIIGATNESPAEVAVTPITNSASSHSSAPPFVRNDPNDRMRMSEVRMMQESLDLTDDQVKQLEPILEQQRKELSAFRRQTSLSRKDRIARLKQMRETQEAQLQSVLTPEQFEQWRQGPLNLQASQQQQPELWITTHPTNATFSPSR